MHTVPRTLVALVAMSTSALLASGCRDTTQRDERPEPRADAPLSDPARMDASANPPMQDTTASGPDTASESATEAPTMPQTTAEKDRQFLRSALASGLAEVSMSRYVEGRSPTAEVRALAKRIADDHEALNARLRDMAAADLDGVEMDASAKAMETMIRATEAPALDRTYLQHMAEGHAKSIARYETAAANAADAGVRKLAEAALPKLREHARAVETRLAQGK